MKRLQTRVGTDPSRYTENFFLGMSPRQTLCGVAGVAVVAVSHMLLGVPDIVSMLLGMPLFVMGFYRPDGLPVEKYAQYWLESTLVRPIERVWDERSELYELLWKGRLCGRQVEGRERRRRGDGRDEKGGRT